MPIEASQKLSPEKTRKALLVDGDNDRYRRKERTGQLQHAGFKVFPVLKIEHARARTKPGAFDLIVVIPGENGELATEFCDEVHRNNPNQQILLVGANQGISDRNYAVSSWEELMKRVGTASGGSTGQISQPQNSLTAA